ncbi:PEGA domain-containing protein [Methylophaga sulfidovorans]|uniref:Formylglycine-generating enzyme, required for sulfatase activity, contains SUMF1/FGE domain n=1 Tax=Methylophaga sulfidovorans TaxID=45496 RepID=A0A1I3WIM5_9GAMM|nr:PEGA domain-containing protein [Methylophaga sulfidovorans]SFK07292.1 Formylglycine-generating enzyme, required for sulfatase activity, contains SUMF1/FGE domain [Methylophaga sulfidovorans]
MSEFNQAIEAAKRQQRRMLLWLGLGFIVVASFVAAALITSRATPVQVLPESISQYAQLNVSRGLALIIDHHLYSLSSSAEVEASAPGYQTATQLISQSGFGKVTQITLQPLPAEIILKTALEDNKTSWYVDKNLTAISNTFTTKLEQGDYNITASHPYFEPVTKNYTLKPGDIVEKTLSFTPITGELSLSSQPAGAKVSIEGKEVGQTPLSISLPGGQYPLQIQKAGFETVTDSINITQRTKHVSRQYRLPAERARVSLSVSPVGGTLTVNGIDTPVADVVKIEANKNTVLSYKKPGYFSQSQHVNLKQGESTKLNFSLKKEMGKVVIESTPQASVTINNKTIGQTPLTLTLDALPQTIRFDLAGYRSETRTIMPSAKSTSSVSVNLLTEKQARLQEAPRHYKTRAGDEMQLFTPNDTIIMGAERSEPGQRANEFIRKVTINRPFYAGVHEVTNQSYAQFDKSHGGTPNLPATSVSWLDTVRYANWLSQAESLTPVYKINGNAVTHINDQADGYRLLTEAEWEWLARKAARPTQTIFVWGNDKTIPPKAVNIADESAKGSVTHYVPRYNDGYAGVAPVMSMKRELSGLFDMGGNVSEWTHDSYSLTVPKQGHSYAQTLDTTLSDEHVVKGANWRSGTLSELRASYRDGASQARDDIGFRLGRFVYGGH